MAAPQEIANGLEPGGDRGRGTRGRRDVVREWGDDGGEWRDVNGGWGDGAGGWGDGAGGWGDRAGEWNWENVSGRDFVKFLVQNLGSTTHVNSQQPTAWTDDTDGDIYLMTSDEVRLRVSKEKLAHSSEMFHDMFSLVNSYANGQTDGTEHDPIKIEETDDVFRHVLLHVYFEKAECSRYTSLDDYFSAIRASRKYLMPQVTLRLVEALKSSSRMKRSPGRIYAFACAQGDLSDLVDAASKETLRCGLLKVDLEQEGDLITGRQYQDLVDLHHMRTTRAIQFIDSLQTKKKKARSHHGWDDGAGANSQFRCACNKDLDSPPLWLFQFCTYAKTELNRAPVSDDIFSGLAVLEILQDIPCRECASNMRKYWPKVLKLKVSIDQLPTCIKRKSNVQAVS